MVALSFWGVQLCVVIQGIEWSKYSNCTINSSKYLRRNQQIHFHHHHQIHLIHYFVGIQMLLLHVIQYRIWVRPGYFINQVRPAWPRQNITRLPNPVSTLVQVRLGYPFNLFPCGVLHHRSLMMTICIIICDIAAVCDTKMELAKVAWILDI